RSRDQGNREVFQSRSHGRRLHVPVERRSILSVEERRVAVAKALGIEPPIKVKVGKPTKKKHKSVKLKKSASKPSFSTSMSSSSRLRVASGSKRKSKQISRGGFS